jgi:quercetin dioxygenase-like cupin family protein
VTHVFGVADLARDVTSYELEGDHHGDTGVPFILEDAPPTGGAKLHRHPYEEVFVVLEGSVTFTAGDEVVVVPAGVPHMFVNDLISSHAPRVPRRRGELP